MRFFLFRVIRKGHVKWAQSGTKAATKRNRKSFTPSRGEIARAGRKNEARRGVVRVRGDRGW